MKSMHLVAALFAINFATYPVLAGEEHGHCSGPNVCKGDADCEKKGFKELTKDECAKIEGAKFEASSHEGEGHKDAGHKHK